ncbi:MAG: hypothetical protein LC791_03715 [Acidobacteria bacterium]|nr:hypothetical protein [Acidobacteriota bacterium]
MHWLTSTHAKRWLRMRCLLGAGPLYQSRDAAIPVDTGWPLLAVCRYVESNPVSAGLVSRAEDWQWSSLLASTGCSRVHLTVWPVVRPEPWLSHVNGPLEEPPIKALGWSSSAAKQPGCFRKSNLVAFVRGTWLPS